MNERDDGSSPSPRPESGAGLDAFGFGDGSWESLLAHARRGPDAGEFGEFTLVELIGRGGQGVVYKAVQPGTGRAVAIKRVAAVGESDERSRERFRREVELAASLHHPGIVTIHGLAEGGAAVVMEWIDGRNADAWADGVRGGAGGMRRIVGVVRRAAEAVSSAHARGVIHRDLKPSNMLVDARDQPRIVDFGLARAVEVGGAAPHAATMTVDGAFAGTPVYAPPEQIDRGLHEADVRADVYALGAVLYRLLTGHEPFRAPTLAGLFDLIRRGHPTAPSGLSAGVDAELDAIVLMALRPDRAERYQTMAEFGDDLGRWMDRKAVRAVPTTTMYLARAFVRRHRVGVGIGALAMLLIVGSGVAAGAAALSLARERTELKKTVEQRDAAAREATEQRVRVQRDFMKSMSANLSLMSVIRAVAEGSPAQREALLDAFARRAGALDASKLPMRPEIAIANRLNLAQVFEALGDPARQKAQLDRAIEIGRARAPDSSDLSEALGQAAFMALGEARYAEAVTLYEESLAVVQPVLRDRDGEFGYAEVGYAEALAGAGRKDDAQRQINALPRPRSTGAVRAEAVRIVAEACAKYGLRAPEWAAAPAADPAPDRK